MKKTILTAATALLLMVAVAPASAATKAINENSYETVVPDELSSFCKAILKGDIDTVKKLIELGEDVNKKSMGKTPAHYAARYNKVEILELLIANGANLKTKCDKGYTAKKYAEQSNATEALEVIKSAMKR